MRTGLMVIVTMVPACAGATAGLAQGQPPALPPSYLPQNGGAGIRTGHITATGATVPELGVPYSAGNTRQDRTIQHQNNAIDRSICKGC